MSNKVDNGLNQRNKKKSKIVTDSKTGYGVPTLIQHSYLHQTKEFFSNSTLHGVRYIAEEGRPFRERFMWFCFILTGIIAAIVIILDLWKKFQTNPTITGLDTDFHNQLLVFPTVMVCPLKPFDADAVQEVAEKNFGVEPEMNNTKYNDFLERIPRLSYRTMEHFYEALSNISDEEAVKKANFRQIAFMTAISCNNTFTSCKYKDEDIDCCEYFKPMYSENGFCYIFNGKYKDTFEKEEAITEQYSLLETDKKWGLKFVPAVLSEVYLHSYQECSGHDFKPNVVWEPNFAVELLISMKQTYTTDQARQLTIAQRKCIFDDERTMKYRQEQYTFTECMRECRIRNSMNAVTDQKMKDFINIEYLTWPIIRYKREVLFGWVDLLVSFGGIAGLFLGFSLLSLVEIVYYFTLRVCCMMYKNRSELYEIIDEKKGKKVPTYDLDWKTEFDYHRKYQEAFLGIESFKVTPVGKETEYTKNVLIGQQKLQQPKTFNNIPKLKTSSKWNKVRPILKTPLTRSNYNTKENYGNVWATSIDPPPYGYYLP
uniref:CSON005221 protein n=1 Tax=Culicoides sonorensis TaxID=179676 RepID=A0A336MSG0_CULSO